MDYLIGLDIGTTAIKGIIMTVDGKVLDSVTGGYNYYGEENQKLLNAEDFLNTCFSTIKKLAKKVDKTDNILAVCSCCASGNLVLLDNENKPLTPIIGWQTAVSEEDKNAFFTKEEQSQFYNMVGFLCF